MVNYRNLKCMSMLVCLAMFSVCYVHAGIKFGDGDINSNDELLFTVKHDIPGTSTYRTLFKAKIMNGECDVRPEILTCYPEQMELLNGSTVLQVRNRYGRVWYDLSKDTFYWKDSKRQIPCDSMRTGLYSVSPDGKWCCYIEKTGYATGALVIENVITGAKKTLDEKANFSYRKVPVKWQDDSSVFVYEKSGMIYFCSPAAYFKGIEASEEYRKIGPGLINSVSWSGGKYLVYIDCDMVYRINSKELYTLGLYSGIIGKGTQVGRLPYQFSPANDYFSVNSDITRMVVAQDGKNFTYYKMKGSATSEYFGVAASWPFISNKAGLLESDILWSLSSEPAIWMRCMPYSKEKPSSSVYRMNEKFTKILDIENSGLPVISPDRSRCAFYSGSTVYVYDTTTWKRVGELTSENVVSLAWDNSNLLYVGGEKTVRRWDLSTKSYKVLMLSSAANGYWDDTNRLIADCGNGWSYIYNQTARNWIPNGEAPKHTNVTRNLNYRVFCGQTQNTRYENALYIRTLKGNAVTKPVLEESIVPTPEKKKLALVFDAYDNADGLSRILYELSLYKVKGTFFLNGEFIRRYPNETNQIVNSDNDYASMFFSTSKLISKDFVMDEDFIRRGLARNEDEFFQCTGHELSLYWHAPYYKKSEQALQTGKDAGYVYVDALCNSIDTVTLEDAVSGRAQYLSPGQIIDVYMKEVKAGKGNILPVTVGISYGNRESYLYDEIDLLLSAILDDDYDIVLSRNLVN